MSQKIHPIPTHLKQIYHIDEETTQEYSLDGDIVCTCGCKDLKIKTFSDQSRYRDALSIKEYNNDYALVIKAECKGCQKSWLIFDLSKHGYDGFVCHQGVEVSDTKLREYKCVECQNNMFNMKIGIEVEDKEQFIEEVVSFELGKYTEEDYVDAFNWIDISLTCSCCKRKFEGWVNLELS